VSNAHGLASVTPEVTQQHVAMGHFSSQQLSHPSVMTVSTRISTPVKTNAGQ